MSSSLDTLATITLDLRPIAPRERHALIFERFDVLLPGQSLRLLSDHDPQPLRHAFEDRSLGRFEWTALQSGPLEWLVQITRTGAAAARGAAGSCCSAGACCA